MAKASPTWNPEQYLKALRFAAVAHGEQRMPGPERHPYVVHLTSVAMEMMGALCHETVDRPDLAIVCSLLHDTIEDTDVSHGDISDRFGVAVADGVQALSKDPSLDKSERMANSLTRIKNQPKEIWMVKLADRITNLQRPPQHWSMNKRHQYWQEAKAIHVALAASSPYLASRITTKIQSYRVYLSDGEING